MTRSFTASVVLYLGSIEMINYTISLPLSDLTE
jgi:hypothetical protein